jgi:hypothetical protein
LTGSLFCCPKIPFPALFPARGLDLPLFTIEGSPFVFQHLRDFAITEEALSDSRLTDYEEVDDTSFSKDGNYSMCVTPCNTSLTILWSIRENNLSMKAGWAQVWVIFGKLFFSVAPFLNNSLLLVDPALSGIRPTCSFA